MSLFSQQPVYCQICAIEFWTDFSHLGGYGAKKECCSSTCWNQLELRRARAIMGKPYTPEQSGRIENNKVQIESPNNCSFSDPLTIEGSQTTDLSVVQPDPVDGDE